MAPAARPTKEAQVERIRSCFTQWDVDSKGYISKHDLKVVLKKLLPDGQVLTLAELDQLMSEADRNQNGKIEYSEFLEWLLRPDAILQHGAEGMSFFDFQELMRPLFALYDLNGDGTVSVEEFVECHNIVQTALTLHPADGNSDPEHLTTEGGELFKKVDGDNDQRVTLEEFVTWQRSALERSGLLNNDLAELIPALTRQLKRVFRLADWTENRQMTSSEEQVLMHIVKNVATFSRDLYNTDERGCNSLDGRVHHENRWSDPPIGLNLDRLKGLHLSTHAVALWGVEDTEIAALCIPPMPTADGTQRRWLARIIRRVTYRRGRREVDEPHYYSYADLSWKHEHSGTEFAQALDALPPEIRIFCQIKSAANFGKQISWNLLQTALEECVENELLTDLQVALYNEHMEKVVVKGMRESGVEGMSGEEELERLRSLTMLAPQSVMATLAQLKIMKVSSVWIDVLGR